MELFDYLNKLHVSEHPTGADFKKYSPYMAMRFLSMNVRNLDLCSAMNRYTFLPLSNEQHYKRVYKLNWHGTGRYIKATKNKDVEIRDKIVDILEAYWQNPIVKRNELEMLVDKRMISADDFETILRDMAIEPRQANQYKKWW